MFKVSEYDQFGVTVAEATFTLRSDCTLFVEMVSNIRADQWVIFDLEQDRAINSGARKVKSNSHNMGIYHGVAV